jgi:hypothetical protein
LAFFWRDWAVAGFFIRDPLSFADKHLPSPLKAGLPMITVGLFTGCDDLACPAVFKTQPPGPAPPMAASAG